jgi:hypothetical protein
VWSIRPDKAFVVNAKPASNTVLSVERYKAPSVMTLDADTPTGLPSEMHMAIVWRAVTLYAGHDENASLFQQATAEYRKMMASISTEEQEAPAWGECW